MHIMQVKRVSLLRTYLSEDKHYVKLESDSSTSSEGVELFSLRGFISMPMY